LNANQDAAASEPLLDAAADAAHCYLIQRELCGLRDHRGAIEDYQIPAKVMARVGVQRRGSR
jgi:hypothetical protein